MTEFLTKENKRRVESFRRVGEDVLLGKVVIDTDKCTGCGVLHTGMRRFRSPKW